MVIGFDAKRAFQNDTGLGNYSRMLICGLAQGRQDLQAVLYAPKMSGDYRSYFSGYANISTRQPSGWDRYFPDLWHGFGIGMHLTGDGVKLYHGLSNELPHGIPKGIKKVVTMHDLLVWRYPQYFKPLDCRVRRLTERHSCKVADVVVAVSEQTKRDLMEVLGVPEEKIRVLYQSSDPIFWQPVPEDDKEDIKALYHLPEKYFVCVGTIEERKNQIAVVEAVGRLAEDVHLVIVGRPRTHYYFDLQRRIRELRLNRRVHIIQNAHFEDFPGLYANAVGSVYVSRFEGFGVPVLESMCCDTPVITSNCSSMPEAGGDAVLYVDPDDVGGIAGCMERLLAEPGLRRELVEKGRRQREKFAPDRVVEKFYSLYDSLVEGEEA